MDELFVLVNAEGEETGSASRSECHDNPELLHRVVHVLIRNHNGETLLQKRSHTKDIQPGKWDTSVGGHQQHGESLEDALCREVTEEVGIALTPNKFEYCYAYIMQNEIESELVVTYTIVHNGPFVGQESEIDELRFWTAEEIERSLGKGIFTPNFEDEYRRYTAWRSSL